MAVHFFETPGIIPELAPEGAGDTAQLRALEGSSQQRSFLLDETVHIVDLWQYPRGEMGEIMVTNSIRSFSLAGEVEVEKWSVLGSSQFADHRAGGLYTQTDVQPVDAEGRRNISWLRVYHDAEVPALFAAPGSMPRYMSPFELPPSLHHKINGAAKHTGHLAMVT